jgi:hypothetical protein
MTLRIAQRDSSGHEVTAKHGTTDVAREYLNYLYSPEGQEIAAKHYYRPRLEQVSQKYAGTFPQIKLFTIEEVFGGWKKAQKTHFDEGGILTRSKAQSDDVMPKVDHNHSDRVSNTPGLRAEFVKNTCRL